MEKPIVGIVMGSQSDAEVMNGAAEILQELGISHEVLVSSAHRNPVRTREWARTASDRGLRIIIAGAGGAAHLAGAIASETMLPVVGVPLASTPLAGFDALLSTVQMPSGVPVATMGVGRSGAKNAALLAARILALADPDIALRLNAYRERLGSR
jgi:phosphoribosylaminoimidazole carboxylase PurE protein